MKAAKAAAVSESVSKLASAGEPPKFLPAEDLVLVLGRALHQAGLPAHQLESILERVAAGFGIIVHVFVLPTGLLITFERPGLPATTLIRLPPKPTDLEKLRTLTTEAELLAAGGAEPHAAADRIRALAAVPSRWGRGAAVLGYSLTAPAFSVFFGGGARELAQSAAVGFAVGLVAFLFGTRRGASRRFELCAATVAGFIAGAGDSYWIPLASGLVALLPGLSLIDAIEELAGGHLTSGASRMAGVGVAFLSLTFGVLLGVGLDDILLGDGPARPTVPFPAWASLLALLAVSAGSVFRFQGRPRDFLLFLAASTVAYEGSRFGASLGHPSLGPFVGALLLAGAAGLYARLRKSAPQLVLVPGLALLVPGAVGLKSMNFLISGDAVTGIEEGFQMFMSAMAIVAGLLAGASLAEPKLGRGRAS